MPTLGTWDAFFHVPSKRTKSICGSHLSALLEALVGFVNSSCDLLVFHLAQLALWVPQPGHHASC